MGSKIDWGKRRRNQKIYESPELLGERSAQQKYGSYREGEFWLGRTHVQRYHPNETHYPGDGVFVNAATGHFEVWKDAKRIAKEHWKQDWRKLCFWAHKFGIQT